MRKKEDKSVREVEMIDEFPSFSLECLYDDRRDPTEVTVFDPDSSDIATAWMTADVGDAVTLDQSR